MKPVHELTMKTTSWNILKSCLETKSLRYFDNLIIKDGNVYATDGRMVAIEKRKYNPTNELKPADGFYTILSHKKLSNQVLSEIHIQAQDPAVNIPQVHRLFTAFESNAETKKIGNYAIDVKPKENRIQITSLLCNSFILKENLIDSIKYNCEKRNAKGIAISLCEAEKLKGFQGTCLFSKKLNQYFLQANDEDIQIIILPVIIE